MKTYILENQGKGTVSIQPEQLKKIAGATTSSGEGIQSIQEGDNISIDNTDPLNPIVSATGGGTTVTKTSDLVNDGEDGINPYISLNDIPVVDISTKAEVDASNLTPTNVISWRDALSVYSKSQVDGFVSTLDGKITTEKNRNDTQDGRITANETAITDLNIHQIVISTSASITTNTVGSVTGKSQHGRNVRIDNGVNAINLSCESTSNADFIASYTHWGTADITFTNGSGITVNDMTGTSKVLKAGGSATLERYGSVYRLRISNP